MYHYRMNQNDLETLWKFVRGDLAAPEFESWLYNNEKLEDALGSALHFELISANYRNHEDVFDIQEKLRTFLRPPLKCECLPLPDRTIIPMGCDGLDKRFFATVQEIRSYERNLWWLHLSHCKVCGQNWMIAQEERIYDDYMVKRLTEEEASLIIHTDKWPDDFLTYEKVLKVGQALSKACRFFDPMSYSLIDTVKDLRRDRPEITTAEMATLLGITAEHVNELIKLS
jgi:hypothetical protein